jgi:hypothetical protein
MERHAVPIDFGDGERHEAHVPSSILGRLLRPQRPPTRGAGTTSVRAGPATTTATEPSAARGAGAWLLPLPIASLRMRFEALRNACALPGARFAYALFVLVGSSARPSHDPPQQNDHRDTDQNGNNGSRLHGLTCSITWCRDRVASSIATQIAWYVLPSRLTMSSCRRPRGSVHNSGGASAGLSVEEL